MGGEGEEGGERREGEGGKRGGRRDGGTEGEKTGFFQLAGHSLFLPPESAGSSFYHSAGTLDSGISSVLLTSFSNPSSLPLQHPFPNMPLHSLIGEKGP